MFPSRLLHAAVLIASLLPAPLLASTAGLLTIADGEVMVLRGTQRFAAAEGLVLQADDIVRTGEATRLARLELSDGSTLDLGAATELLLRPSAKLAGRASLLYLARGWLKVDAAEASGSIAAPQLDVPQVAGRAVLRVTPQAALVFAESGTVRIDERTTLRDGDAWVRRGGTAGALLKRPPAELMQDLPRGFVDSLPRRSARFEGTSVPPGSGEELRYAEMAHWLNAEPALRAAFVPRFAARARDRAFRAGLVAELRAHPEWHRTLFPEKYRPKPAIVVRRPAPAASSVPAEPAVAPPVAVNLQGLMSWPHTPSAAQTNPTVESR